MPSLVLALLAGDHGDVIERVGVFRVDAQHLDVALHGLRELALAVVEQALLEQRGDGRGFGHARVLSRLWRTKPSLREACRAAGRRGMAFAAEDRGIAQGRAS